MTQIRVLWLDDDFGLEPIYDLQAIYSWDLDRVQTVADALSAIESRSCNYDAIVLDASVALGNPTEVVRLSHFPLAKLHSIEYLGLLPVERFPELKSRMLILSSFDQDRILREFPSASSIPYVNKLAACADIALLDAAVLGIIRRARGSSAVSSGDEQ